MQRGAGVEHVPVERSLPSRGFSNRRAMGRKRVARRRVTDASRAGTAAPDNGHILTLGFNLSASKMSRSEGLLLPLQ